LGLVEKANNLDNFKNERYLEKEFIKENYDYNGADYDRNDINTENYTLTYKTSENNIIEVKMVFKEYQISAFKTALKDLKNSFVEEYLTSYIPLVDKIAFGNSLRQHLQNKLETFRNNKTGRIFAGFLSEFIDELSLEYIDVVGPTKKTINSFKYRYLHRATLSKLYHALIKNDLIGKETKELDFINIFQNKEIDNPVRWTGQTSELIYFIKLINRKDLGFEDTGSFKWRIAVKCFVKVSSSTLKKITYTDLRTYKVTENTKLKLDDILVNKVLII